MRDGTYCGRDGVIRAGIGTGGQSSLRTKRGQCWSPATEWRAIVGRPSGTGCGNWPLAREIEGRSAISFADKLDNGTDNRLMVYLTRKAEFSASHTITIRSSLRTRMCAFFGKCNNPYGHGHNYTLEVTVKGAVNPKSGLWWT